MSLAITEEVVIGPKPEVVLHPGSVGRFLVHCFLPPFLQEARRPARHARFWANRDMVTSRLVPQRWRRLDVGAHHRQEGATDDG